MALNPVQIVEVNQPRCGLRFGVGACTATGTPKCYNVWGTCKAKAAFDPTGSIKWRFMAPRPGQWFFGDFADADNPETHAIFADGLTVSTFAGELNVAGILEGKSPFGVLSGATISMADPAWDDRWGDFYPADRPADRQFGFWEVWVPRNPFYAEIFVTIYDGYEGQALGDMRKRLYVLDKVNGPDASGRVTLECLDPARLADADKAKYPPTMEVRLLTAITETSQDVRVNVSALADLTKAYGNTGARYLRIGNEILGYTGQTEVEAGVYDLTGVTRGQLGTTAATAAVDARCQRAAHWRRLETWRIAQEILEESPIPNSLFDFTDWANEAVDWLSGIASTTTIAEPTPMLQLLAEASQQGMFYVWWSEYDQQFRFEALKPPQGDVPLLTEGGNLLADSTLIVREPDARVTRVFLYYAPRDPTQQGQPANYERLRGLVEGDNESEQAGGIIKERVVFARFINTEGHAYQVIARILSRYRNTPEFLTFRVDSKDRALTMGSVCDVLSRQIKDVEGVPVQRRWQVVRFEEARHGEIYVLRLQSFDLIGRFAYITADDAPDYLDATAEEREFGWWFSDDDGLMSNGDEGYKFQ